MLPTGRTSSDPSPAGLDLQQPESQMAEAVLARSPSTPEPAGRGGSDAYEAIGVRQTRKHDPEQQPPPPPLDSPNPRYEQVGHPLAEADTDADAEQQRAASGDRPQHGGPGGRGTRGRTGA